MIQRPSLSACVLTVTLSSLLSTASHAELRAPYSPDEDTPFLFALDEPAGTILLENTGNAGGQAIAIGPNDAGVSAPPTSAELAGAAAFPGFGRAVDFTNRPAHFLGWDANESGEFEADTNDSASPDRIALSSLGIGNNAPFTLEALIRPSTALGNHEIICTDSSVGQRGFQFRMLSGGTTGQQLEFHLIANGAQQFAPIPNSGVHAFAEDRWFHVAFVFDGSEGSFYWTRLASEAPAAQQIGSPTQLSISDVGMVEGPLVFGNENRNASNEGLQGRLDEVRISSIARASDEFLFAEGDAIQLTGDDPIGTSSFDSAGQWSSEAAPSSGNIYAVANFLRSPASDADVLFAGDRLRLSAGGALLHKGTAQQQTLTIPELVLNGGLIRAGTPHSQTFRLAGSMTVTGDGSTIHADQADIEIESTIEGSGDLELAAGVPDIPHQLTVLGEVTMAGDIFIRSLNASSQVRFASESEIIFRPDEFGSSSRITGTGHVSFDGPFTIDLSQTPETPGRQWSFIDHSSLSSVTFGENFAVTDWTENDGIWTDPSGVYTFSESSGNLLVVPPPGSDSDEDGLDDDWEVFYFGGINFGPDDDPDGDGDDNATEFANGSAPTNAASNVNDSDSDGLVDQWERDHFENLDLNAGDDPDGDGFGNLQEQDADTRPDDSSSRPTGTAVRLVPLNDGDTRTSEYGFAGNSAINTVSFVRSSIQTYEGQQFVTWYGRHEHDPNAQANNTIWIGRRDLGATEWEVFRHPFFTANNINDGHDVICYGIDGDGYMHLSWGMHGDEFHYSRSTAPVTGSDPISLGPDVTMTGNENTVTYPQFLRLPNGDLIYLFREGASGSGDTYLNRYELATETWRNVHGGGQSQEPFIQGRGWSPDYNAYPNMPQLGGPDGNDLFLTWCWRYEPVGNDSPAGENGYQTNNMIAFARSPDGGETWQRFDGSSYTLPISRDGENGDPATSAEHIVDVPEGSSYINQASMCLDASGNPVVASWWAPGAQESPPNHRRQYMIAFYNDQGTSDTGDDAWETRQVSRRTVDPPGTKYFEGDVRDLGRPIVVADEEDRIIVAYRDDAGTNGLTLMHTLPEAQDPERRVWIEVELTSENLGNYEPIIDNELWEDQQQLHFLYQASEGEGYTAPDNLASRISVLEWNAAAYFDQPGRPTVEFAPNGSDVTISIPSEPSWSYRLLATTDFVDWEPIQTLDGTGSVLTFLHEGGATAPKRFWRVESAEGGF